MLGRITCFALWYGWIWFNQFSHSVLLLQLRSFEVQECPKVNIAVVQRFYSGTFKKNRTRLQFDWSHILSKTHTSHKALAESNFPLKCSKKGIIIFYHLLPTLHSFGPHEAGKHSKSIWVYIIGPPNHWKKYYPTKNNADLLNPKPLHPQKTGRSQQAMQPDDSWRPPQHRDEGEPEKTRWWDQDCVPKRSEKELENGSVRR